MADEVPIALAEIAKARDDAALPLTFAVDAAAASDQRSEAQFRASLPKIPGGWAKVRDGILSASVLFGQVAKAIATFHDPKATVITLEQMGTARAIAERECRLRLAATKGKSPDKVDVSDGLVC